MNIVLLCATQRGLRFLEKLHQLVPEHHLIVFSFRETPWEPPFLDDIAKLTQKVGGQFFENSQVGHKDFANFWATTPIDLMLVVSWRYLIPSSIYLRSRLGTYVFHDSPLPTYRGFSPTVWAMVNGESHTGVTLFQMADDVDSGDIVAQQSVEIGYDDTIKDVLEKVTVAYLQVLEANIHPLLAGTAPHTPQNHEKATFTCKRLPEDNLIDWQQSTQSIYNLIRATTYPYTGAYTFLNGQKLIIWEAKMVNPPKNYVGRVIGRVVGFMPNSGATVLTSDGELYITKVQLNDGKIQDAGNVLNRVSYTLGR